VLKILSNPFDDVEPRKDRVVEKRKKRDDRGDRKKMTEEEIGKKKNMALLSFGDEADEDEQQATSIRKVMLTLGSH